MFEEYQPEIRQGKVNLYLVEPSQKLSYQFAILRNELDRNNIPYQGLVGFDEIRELMNDKINKNLIVVNSSNIARSEFPREVFNVYGNQIYFYPKRYQNFGFLANANNVLDLYRSYVGGAPLNKAISLRSIKKDLQRFSDKRPFQEMYDKIMIMHPKGYNPQYEQLFNVLQSFKNKVMPISRENQAQHHRQGKSLLIMEKEAFDSINKFLIDNRLENNIDLAILGYVKSFNKRKNYAIMTEYPNQIIEYLDQAGLNLPGVKQKLSMIKANGMGNSNNSMKGQFTGYFQTYQGAQPTFSPNVAQYNRGQPTQGLNDMNNIAISNGVNGVNMINNIPNDHEEVVTYQKYSQDKAQNSQIPLHSKISESSMGKSKKSVKKVKKVQSSQASSINQNVTQAPVINIKIVDSQESQQKIKLNNEIYFDHHTNGQNHNIHNNSKQANQVQTSQGINYGNNFQNGQKPIMNWYLYPDKNKKSQYNNGPLFILEQQNGNIVSNKVNNNSSYQLIQSQKNISQPQLINPVPLSPSSNQTTNNNAQFILSTPDQIYSNTNINQSAPIVSPSSSKFPPKQPSSFQSRQSIQSQQIRQSYNSAQNLGIPYELQQQKRQKIQQKYNKGNQIRQLSDQYHGSNLSFPVDESSQKVVNNSSNFVRNEVNHTRSEAPQGMNRSSEYYYSQFRNSPNIGDNVAQAYDMKKSSIYENGNNPIRINALSERIGSTSSMNTNQSKKEIERVQYDNKFSTTAPTYPTNIGTISSGSALSASNTRVIRNELSTPQTYYQQQTSKTITTKKQLSSQPMVTQNVYITDNKPIVYRPSQGRLYNAGDTIRSIPEYTNNNTTGTTTSVYQKETYTSSNTNSNNLGYIPINSTINQTTNTTTNNRGSSPLSNPTYSPINAVIANAINPTPTLTSNQAYADINKTIVNAFSNKDDNRRISSYLNTNENTYGSSGVIRHTSRNEILTNTNTIKPQGRTSITYTQQTKTVNPLTNTITSYNTDTSSALKNYMETLGITQQKYDIVTDANGKRTYKLKQTISNTKNTDILDRYKSALKETITITPKGKGVFNWDEYDEHVDEKGRKYYTIKKSNIITSPNNASRTDLYSPSSQQSHQLLLQSKSASRIETMKDNFNTNRDKDTIYNSPNVNSTLQLPLYTQKLDKNSYSSNNGNNISSQQTIRKQIVQTTTHTTTNNNLEKYYNSPNTERSYNISNNYNSLSLSGSGNSRLVAQEHEETKSPDGQVKTVEDYERREDLNGKTYEVNKRYSVSPGSMTKEIKQRQMKPGSMKQVYEVHIQTKIGPYDNMIRDEKAHENTYEYKEIKSNNFQSPISVRADNYNSSRSSQFYEEGSRTSRDSLLTDSKPSSLNKIINVHQFGDNKTGDRPKIYIQHPHKGIDQEIERNFPGVYNIKYFNNASEITEKSRDNFILLHRQADNIGSQFDRNLGTLILLGGRKGDRIPSGTVNIPTTNELIKNIL